MANASRDSNNVPTLLAVSSVDGTTPVAVYADPVTHRLLTSTGASGDVVGPASSTDKAIVRFSGTTGKLVQNSNITIGDTDNVVIPSASTLAWSTDLFLKRVAAKQLSITGDGTGSASGMTGWTLGNSTTGYSGIWHSAQATPDATNYILETDNNTVFLRAPGTLNFLAGGSTKGAFDTTAGAGLYITAGTANTADANVYAQTITQTWNNAAVLGGVRWTFTDTVSAAGANALKILGGASGTTSLFTVAKDGAVTAASQFISPAASGFAFTGDLTTRWGSDSASSLSAYANGTQVLRLRTSSVYSGTDILAEGTSGFVLTFGGSPVCNLSRVSNGVVGVGVGTAGDFTGSLKLTGINNQGKTTVYNAVTTAGWGTPAIYGSGRSTAQTAAVASVATYTVGAADGSFVISSNVNVTTSTAHSFTVTCAYTDETNTARTLTLSFIQVGGGTPITTITNVTGAGPYEGVANHIRCKAATAITIATTGTFTTVTYNVEAVITQIM